jgi:hypothetical protein
MEAEAGGAEAEGAEGESVVEGEGEEDEEMAGTIRFGVIVGES